MKRFSLFVMAIVAFFTVAARADEELSFDFFYDQLAPYGDWEEVGDYGYVWHPAGVAEDWAPYTDGYWSYTDAGWTWVSYEDFGGIVYHYGRWVQVDEIGWCWVPDYQWGPAWVSWRKNDDYVGWAPLPPEANWDQDSGLGLTVDTDYDIGPLAYNFCPVRSFGAPVIREVCVPRTRNVSIIFETVNITNICYRDDYGCVFSGGFDYDWIAPRCERPLPCLRLVRNTTNIFIVGNHGNIFINAQRGNALIVAAPALSLRANFRVPSRKIQVARALPKIVVQRGWTGLDREGVRDRLLVKMRDEHKDLPARKAPARPIRAGQVSVLPAQVDLAATLPGKTPGRRPNAPARIGASIPVDPEAIKNPAHVPGDRNHDGKPDRVSRVPGDRNGDGKPDRTTGVPGDRNGDGIPDRVRPERVVPTVPGDRNGDGKPDRVVPTPGDRNGDGKPDRTRPERVVPVVPSDRNGDGKPDRVVPTPGERNGDGKPDRTRPERVVPVVPGDRNGDGIPDRGRPERVTPVVPGDRNGDGKPDRARPERVTPVVPGDRNGDGKPDRVRPERVTPVVPGDRNGDGKPDRVRPVPGDRNGDGKPDRPTADVNAGAEAVKRQAEVEEAQRTRAAEAARASDTQRQQQEAMRERAAAAAQERAAEGQRQQQAAAADARQRAAAAAQERAGQERAAEAQRQQAASMEARQQAAAAAQERAAAAQERAVAQERAAQERAAEGQRQQQAAAAARAEAEATARNKADKDAKDQQDDARRRR